MPKKKRKTTGAKQRYDKENPTVSFRLTKEEKQTLDTYIEAAGGTFTDFVKESIDKKLKDLNEIWSEGFEEGREAGQSEGYSKGQRNGYKKGFKDGQEQMPSLQVLLSELATRRLPNECLTPRITLVHLPSHSCQVH